MGGAASAPAAEALEADGGGGAAGLLGGEGDGKAVLRCGVLGSHP